MHAAYTLEIERIKLLLLMDNQTIYCEYLAAREYEFNCELKL